MTVGTELNINSNAYGYGSSASSAIATEIADENLPATQSLKDFLATAGKLTPEERKLIVEQAIVMLEHFYVHLPLKRAMHAVDPLQRLRLLLLRLPFIENESAFHSEMISIYNRLRDLHTTYVLPDPYRSVVAALPFRIEEFFENRKRKYIVTKVSSKIEDKYFTVGVMPTHWNGIPIDRAVELNADREPGSNEAARHAQGLESLTNRWMGRSLPPDEEWVVIRYDDGETTRESRFEWEIISPGSPAGGVDLLSRAACAITDLGVNTQAEIQRRVLKHLFSPQLVRTEKKLSELGTDAEAAVAPAAEIGFDLNKNSILPDVFSHFGSVKTPQGDSFGYIRIRTFSFEPDPFVREFIRLLGLVPQNGLILDVRGNGGGYIASGERILQTLTPEKIEPALFSFISSPLTNLLCATPELPELALWSPSLKQSIQTASAFSQGFPLTSAMRCNDIGQKYQGPVVLITDAQCYSTTDMFAAGFQDHGIGKIIGTAPNTGAGGANVWTHQYLVDHFPKQTSPFASVPRRASFNVAIRRSTRVGHRAGVLLEDLGVVPEKFYFMSRNDVLNKNADLLNYAAGILKGEEVFKLSAVASNSVAGACEVTVTTRKLDRVDCYVNGRPQLTLNVEDGDKDLELPAPAVTSQLELRGYKQGQLKASTRLSLFPNAQG